MYYEILCNMDNLREAYRLAHRGKSDCEEVIEFDKNKIYNLNNLLVKLENKDWDDIFKYYRFKITIPKERIVDALTFEGRIVQHVLCDKILKPYFEPRLIKENCACRVGKGTDYAINLIKEDMVKFLKTHDDGYVLKMDVKKFFPSIDRSVLKELISDFPDKEVLEMLYWIIDHSPESNGLPIGNQTSQWFALYYLNKIDRIIKEQYGIKYYVRYMDDLVIIHENKRYLSSLRKELENFAFNYLHLTFNNKTQIFPLHKGFSFLGWKFLYDSNNYIYMKLDHEKRRLRIRKIRESKNEFSHNEITKDQYLSKIQSLKVNLERGNTYYFIKRYL